MKGWCLFLVGCLLGQTRGDARVIVSHYGVKAFLPCDSSSEKTSEVTWTIHGHTAILLTVTKTGTVVIAPGRGGLKYTAEQPFGTLGLPDARETDSNNYVCTAMARDGTRSQATTSLRVGKPPRMTVEAFRAPIGAREVTLAECTAADSWGAARIEWHFAAGLGLKAPPEWGERSGEDVMTVRRKLTGTPSAAMADLPVTCVVTHAALALPVHLPEKLRVEVPPGEPVVAAAPGGFLECAAPGSPTPDISWTGFNFPEPTLGSRLPMIEPRDSAIRAYECAARNPYGGARVAVYVQKITVPARRCWPSLLGVLAAGALGALAVFAFCRVTSRRRALRSLEDPELASLDSQ